MSVIPSDCSMMQVVYAECAIIRTSRDGGGDENKLRNFLHPPTTRANNIIV